MRILMQDAQYNHEKSKNISNSSRKLLLSKIHKNSVQTSTSNLQKEKQLCYDDGTNPSGHNSAKLQHKNQQKALEEGYYADTMHFRSVYSVGCRNFLVPYQIGTVLAVISICVAPFVINAPSYLYDFLQDCFGFYAKSILTVILVSFYTKRVPAIAPKVTLIVHAVLYGLIHFEDYDFHYLYIRGALFILDICIMLVIGRLRPRETPFELTDAGVVNLTPWRLAKPASVVCFLAMLGVYALFSPLGLAG